MKNSLLIASFIFAIFTSISTFAVPASYPLKCRGTSTAEMLFEFSPTTALLSFKKSLVAAPAGLNPGECAWMDRPLNLQEPIVIEHHPLSPKNIFGTTTIRYGHTYNGTSIVAPLIGGRDPEIGWMKDLLSANNYWLFQVYNDGSGHFIVTSAQPSTP